MKSNISKVIGIVLLVTAITGILFSLVGITQIWLFKKPLTQQVLTKVGSFIYVLDTTSQGLTLLSQALDTAVDSATTLETTMQVLSSTIIDSAHWFDTASELSGKDLPEVVISLQNSLRSAQASAKLVDDTLTIFSTIPFFPAERYNPQVPLSAALGQAADSLSSLPDTLKGVTDDLKDAGKNLDTIKTQSSNVADQVKRIKESLTSAQEVVAKYKIIVADLQPSLTSLQSRLPYWITLAAWGLTAILAWLGFAQIGLVMQSLTLLGVNLPYTTNLSARENEQHS
jgi:methyl-accepting chemotaxis protein